MKKSGKKKDSLPDLARDFLSKHGSSWDLTHQDCDLLQACVQRCIELVKNVKDIEAISVYKALEIIFYKLMLLENKLHAGSILNDPTT